MAMDEETRALLAAQRQQRRAERIESERERSDHLARQALNSDRLRVGRLRARYFREKYGENWREVMEDRAAGDCQLVLHGLELPAPRA